ncbi:hypothetical protein GCM10009621_15230 [Corynebacterium felinum]|uniref:Uncharacterized protein n=2 Tax=Corynebacterium TaxID=1716 RepID=A0ABU2BBA5_9CORY|nr:hypothetical protein [Corynebacterium felinum]
MTRGMNPAPMSVTAPIVADAVVNTIRGTRTSTTIWIPKKLRILAWIMRCVPRPLWRKMPR